MAGTHRIGVQFPLGGQFRGARYAQKMQPYTTPLASNVRGVGPLESRRRGGTRPGLAKFLDNDFGDVITAVSSVTYVDGDGNRQQDVVVICDGTLYVVRDSSATASVSRLALENGDYILAENGDYLVFESYVTASNPLIDSSTFNLAEAWGKLYIADSVLKKYSPRHGSVEVVTGAPSGQPLVAIYQERVVLTGADHTWYMSAQGDDTDWDATADMDNAGRAVMGHLGNRGVVGEKPLAIYNYDDSALIFGCQDSIWVMYGNITNGGSIKNVSRHMGVVSPYGMTVTPDGMVVFLTRRGLYSWSVGSAKEPEPLSPNRLPEELLDVDITTTDVLVEYDHRENGVHVFLTPATGSATHFWVDLEMRAFWPVEFGNNNHQPLATAVVSTSGYSDVLLGCKDGYVRRFSDDATNDDGTSIQSNIILGPFHVSRAEGIDGQVKEVVGALGAGSGTVTWAVMSGDSAEEVVDAAGTALAGSGISSVYGNFTWVAGQNDVEHVRSRGPWAIIWLSSTAQWSYEAISMVNRRLGRLR